MSGRLTHWSAAPIAALDPAWDYSGGRSRLDKPHGLWVSVEGNGDGWSDWCRAEEFGVERLAHEYEVTLAPTARILRITTPEGIDAFTEQYAQAERGLPLPPGWAIDWQRVAQEYQGILITPYQWSRRLVTGWYYSWDCASGCIWDLAAVDFHPAGRTGGSGSAGRRVAVAGPCPFGHSPSVTSSLRVHK